MIIQGIDFPNELIKSMEENKLVVFVGAGVSMGNPTKLPSFDDLAEEIAGNSGIERDKNDPCDIFLGKIKSNNINVNKIAAEKLSESKLQHNKLHEYIIRLFGENQVVRIVTTNYDQMLEQASKCIGRKVKVFNSPALSLGNDIDGIVHIHGNVDDPEHMVLTDSDFGNAYMVEGYASRFLSEIFKNYTVLFVGYSYNDVIVRYLTRAIVKNDDFNKYILIDQPSVEWQYLGIKPIIFPKEDYDTLYGVIDYLGKLVNRKPSEWKELLVGYDVPPSDSELASELEYCLEDKNRRRLFSEIVHGEEWLWWLDQHNVFDNIFSNSDTIINDDSIWIDWIIDNFACCPNQVIQNIIIKHNGMYNKNFAIKILNYGVRNADKVSNDNFMCLVGLFKNQIDNQYILYDLIEILADKRMYVFAWDLFKKYYEFSIKTENGFDKVEYDLKFLGSNFEVKESWKKIKDELLRTDSYEMLEFVKEKILEIHDQYCFLEMTDDEHETFRMSMLPIEKEERNCKLIKDDVMLILSDIMEESLHSLDEVKDDYVKSYLNRCLNSRSVFLRKISLKILRDIHSIDANEKLEVVLKNLNSYFPMCKDQFFRFIDEVFGEVSQENRNNILKIIDSGKYLFDEYEKYNWCVGLSKKHDCVKLRQIVNDITKKHPDYRPRKNPGSSQTYFEVRYGDESPVDSYELMNKNLDELIELLINYKNTNPLGPNRDGLLKTLEECIKNNGLWIDDLIVRLNESFDAASDIWPFVYNGITESKVITLEQYAQALSILSDEKFVNNHQLFIGRLMSNFILKSDKSKINEFKDRMTNVAQNIINDKSADNWLFENQNDIFDSIALSLNSASSVCVRVLILLYSRCEDKEGEKYLKIFKNVLSEKRRDRSLIICVMASYFDYFLKRNKEWCFKNLSPVFSSKDKSVFCASWEGYLASHEGLYDNQSCVQDKKIVQDMYLKAIGNFEFLSEEMRQKFISLYADLFTTTTDNPIGCISKLMKKSNDDDRCSFADVMYALLDDMSEERVNVIWNKWLKQYIYNRVNNIPIKFSEKELGYVSMWVFALGKNKKEFIKLLSPLKVSADYMDDFLRRIEEDNWYKKNLDETQKMLRWILKSDEISNIIFDEIDKIISLLEEEGENCETIRESVISKGRAS